MSEENLVSDGLVEAREVSDSEVRHVYWARVFTWWGNNWQSKGVHQPGKDMLGEDDAGVVFAGGQLQEDLAAKHSPPSSQPWKNGC